MPIVSGGAGGSGGIGSTSLVYRFTVSGADKASIDTGVDAAQAGSSDFSGGDVFEVWFYARTDEATVESAVNLTLNNDTTAAHYLYSRLRANGGTVAQLGVSATAVSINIAGANASASAFTSTRLCIPAYAGTTGNKAFEIFQGLGDTTTNNSDLWGFGGDYVNTAAITRLAVAPNTGGAKFKVGSSLLIYKRASS